MEEILNNKKGSTADIKVFANIIKLIQTILPNSPIPEELIHAELVHKWLRVLKPDANQLLQIAAWTHDLERAITGLSEKDRPEEVSIQSFKQQHADRSSLIISNIMEWFGYNEEDVTAVKNLVSNHEVGGDPDSDLLMDADSLAFL